MRSAAKSTKSTRATALARPRLVLRVAVAGTRKICPAQRTAVAESLRNIYGAIASEIEILSPGVPPSEIVPDIAAFYAGDRLAKNEIPARSSYPLLRVISGLADGADQIAFLSLLNFRSNAVNEGQLGHWTAFELVAVLPCDPVTFRDRSPVLDKQTFNSLLPQCDTVIQLDGICPASPRLPENSAPDSPEQLKYRLDKRRRARCFRAQSKVLLRQCDILVAILDPDSTGKVGGTIQTISAALDLAIPVLVVTLPMKGSAVEINLVRSMENIYDLNGGSDWQDGLNKVLIRILADPKVHRKVSDVENQEARAKLADSESKLLKDLFSAAPAPREYYRRWIWSKFEKHFKDPKAKRKQSGQKFADEPISYFKAYRKRASDLSSYHAGSYRGAFLSNYLMAAWAVFLAGFSLLWVIFRGRLTEEWALIVLAALGLAKLIALYSIYRNTRRGNRDRWNDQAIDFRYLTERLRTFYYLPLLGVLHMPQPKSAQYAGSALRQNVVDWVLHAIVRQSPANTGLVPIARPSNPEFAWDPTDKATRFFKPDLPVAGERFANNWLSSQIDYHAAVESTQEKIVRWFESRMGACNIAVIVAVIADLTILSIYAFLHLRHVESEAVKFLHEFSPVLIFVAVVLPALVASMNGLSFQSECQRISLRSKMMALILEARKEDWLQFQRQLRDTPSDTDAGSWILQAIDLGESCAQALTDEVAEWSVLYSRDLSDV